MKKHKNKDILTCGELIRYLSQFNTDQGIAVAVADVKKRIHYKLSGYHLWIGEQTPALLFETSETEPLDKILEVDEPEKTEYKCDNCLHNPPSSFSGKPCSQCDTNDPSLNFFQRR